MLSVTSCDATMDGISSSVITSLAVANRSFGSTMSRSRAASTAGGSDSARTPTVLSRWASRYLEGRNLESAGLLKSTAEALIQQNHARQVVARDKVFKQGLPFSWLRFFIGVGSLALVFSDIFRGGLGVSSLEKYYPSLHPDEVLGFGTSWNYSVFAATKEDAYSGNVNATVWTYKFDSTSIVWRAFANHLSISEYPDCFLYKSQCPSESFDGDAAYRMIDSVVDAIAGLNSTRTKRASTAAGPVGLTLRTENDYIDRLHQFLLPKWFTNFNWRTNQALYYSPQSLLKANARSICFPVKRARVKTPRFCRELWTNLNRSCAPSDTSSRAAGLLYVHTMERLREIQARFPNATVDLTFLESQEDMQVCRGSLTTTGFRRSDVSTIIRARHCVDNGHSSKVCETVFVEDYRYETGLLISDVVQWYTLVASLRGFGQTYFWLRGFGLMLSCFFVFGAIKERTSIQSQIQKTRELLMRVPTQCVVYGSSVPVTCYVIAHLLDAPFTYNVLESHFFSQAGVLQIKPEAFVAYAVVQMRSVWIYALAWHAVVWASALRGIVRSNQLHIGVVGVPEFLLSGFSSVTLVAQYRSTSFRSARVLRTIVFPDNMGDGWEAAKYQYNFVHRGRGSILLGGVVIDLKFLICLLLLLASAWVIHELWSHYWDWKRNHWYWLVLPPTPVPYSAGILWPTVSVCVQWPADYYCIRDERRLGLHVANVAEKIYLLRRHPITSRSWWKQRIDARVFATTSTRYITKEDLRQHPRCARKQTNPYRYIQHCLKCLHGRSVEVEANVAFINAVLMSDPLVYLSMMLGTDHSTELAYYQSAWRPRQILLLPEMVVCKINPYAGGLKLLRRVHPSELTWSQLVQCG